MTADRLAYLASRYYLTPAERSELREHQQATEAARRAPILAAYRSALAEQDREIRQRINAGAIDWDALEAAPVPEEAYDE